MFLFSVNVWLPLTARYDTDFITDGRSAKVAQHFVVVVQWSHLVRALYGADRERLPLSWHWGFKNLLEMAQSPFTSSSVTRCCVESASLITGMIELIVVTTKTGVEQAFAR